MLPSMAKVDNIKVLQHPAATPLPVWAAEQFLEASILKVWGRKFCEFKFGMLQNYNFWELCWEQKFTNIVHTLSKMLPVHLEQQTDPE